MSVFSAKTLAFFQRIKMRSLLTLDCFLYGIGLPHERVKDFSDLI